MQGHITIAAHWATETHHCGYVGCLRLTLAADRSFEDFKFKSVRGGGDGLHHEVRSDVDPSCGRAFSAWKAWDMSCKRTCDTRSIWCIAMLSASRCSESISMLGCTQVPRVVR